MSAPVDVLAALRAHKSYYETVGAYEAADMAETLHAAVAELIAAASWFADPHGDTTSWVVANRRLRAALARCGGQS